MRHLVWISLVLFACKGGDDGETPSDAVTGDDDSAAAGNDSSGGDSSASGDDDSSGGDSSASGDDDSSGGDSSASGDDDSSGGDSGASGDDSGEVEPDTDGDGVVDSLDCDDADPLIFPGAEETCSDGQDNDCDGLLDCEDGHCAASSSCVELDCEDGLDSDADSLTDCDDEDCWTSCGMARVVSRVTSGKLSGEVEHEVYTFHLDSTFILEDTKKSEEFGRLVARSVEGSAKVYTEDATFTCLFHVDTATVSYVWSYEAVYVLDRVLYEYDTAYWGGRTTFYTSEVRVDRATSSSTPGYIVRTGATVSEGCPLPLTSLLPTQLGRHGLIPDTDLEWYAGRITDSTVDRSTTVWGASRTTRTNRTFTASSVSTDGSYVVGVPLE